MSGVVIPAESRLARRGGMPVIRYLVAAASLLAVTALPAWASGGFGVEHHLVVAGGKTYLQAVVHAPRASELEFLLSTPNHGPLYPAIVDDRRCDQATACHYRYELSGRTKEGKAVCPGATLSVSAVTVQWWGLVRRGEFSDSIRVC